MERELPLWLHSYSRVTLTIEIPEDIYVGRRADLLTVVVPFCHEGMRPEGLAQHLEVGIQAVVDGAKAALAEKGYIADGRP